MGDYRVDSHAAPALKESILYKMTYKGIAQLMGPKAFDRARQVPIVGIDPKLSTLEEAYSTENHMVRIYKVKHPDILGHSLFSY